MWVLTFATLTALAHPALSSAVLVDAHKYGVDLELHIPADQLQMARVDAPLQPYDDYLREHVRVVEDSGESLTLTTVSSAMGEVDGTPHLLAQLHFDSTEPLAGFTLVDDVVLHRVKSHQTYVTLRSDPWGRGPEVGAELAGLIRFPNDSLHIDRTPPSASALLYSAFVTGAEHIAGGLDHLLFLLALLAAAARPREGGLRDRALAGDFAKLITAFTLGHSLTLALSALDVVQLPAAWTELAVALSVALSAVHALRPLWPKAELWMAAGFGLIHGLAFAESLALAGVGFEAASLTLLGFDLGLEAVQIGVAAAVFPLLLLARQPRYAALRTSLAVAVLLFAVGWTHERITELFSV